MEKFNKIFGKKNNSNDSALRVCWDETEDIGIVTHYKGKPFTGICYDLHENGNLLEEMEMLEGLKHGKQVIYHEDSSVSEVSYFENDLKIGHDNNTYDKITNEDFPNEKYNDLDEILKKIKDKINTKQLVHDMMVEQGQWVKQNSESYYHTLAGEMVQSLVRQNKLSENVHNQAEEELNKDNDNCERTIKFTDELKKYVKLHNDNAVIYVYPSKYGVWEEFIHKGKWENKNFEMKISIPLKSPDFKYEGSLSDFIEQIGTKKINQLDNTNLDIGLLSDGGGSWQIDTIKWEEKLSKQEEKKFNESEFLSRWLDEGMPNIDEKMVFEKGCIEEIKVTIEDKVFILN